MSKQVADSPVLNIRVERTLLDRVVKYAGKVKKRSGVSKEKTYAELLSLGMEAHKSRNQ